MGLEALILSLCLYSSKGCQEATQSYYVQNKALQDAYRDVEIKVKNNTPKAFIAMSPAIQLMVYRKMSLKISPKINLDVSTINQGYYGASYVIQF